MFTTVTGSHMWNMNRPDSDKDISTVYIVNSEEFIRHGIPKRGKFKQSNVVDNQIYEIGNVINLLIKDCNVNMVWAVMSPLIENEHNNCLKQLRQILMENMSKKIYYSIEGMTRNNIRDFIMKGDHQSDLYKKKLNVIGRGIQFGINMLIYKKAIFQPIHITHSSQLNDLMLQLMEAFEKTTLPLEIDPKPFEDYLYKWRVKKMEIDEIIKVI